MKAVIIFLSTFLLAQSTVLPSNYDYIIVGAGYAGLGACRTLTTAGVAPSKILVIEAKSRIGGRCTNFTYLGVPQDLGAAFIHNPASTNSLDLLANKTSSFPKMRAWFGNYTEWYNKSQVSDSSLNTAYDYYSQFESLVYQVSNSAAPDISVATLLSQFRSKNTNKPQYLRDRLNMAVEIWAVQNGANLTDLSTWEYQPEFDYQGDIDYAVLPTFAAFHQYLWNNGCKATLNLGEKVTNVDYSGISILVTTDKSPYTTKKIMLSPSLGILKAGLAGTPTTASIIKFNPSLPASKVDAINAIGFGKFQKLYVTVNQAFWTSDTRTLLFTCPSTQPSCYYREAWVVPSIPNTFIIWIGGDSVKKLTNMTLDQVKGNLQNFLNGYVNPVPVITNVFMTNWTNDPNVLGGYSYVRVGYDDTTFNALRSVLNVGTKNIWFIGEGTHPADYSYAHGAYQSGVYAATLALKA